MAVTDEQDTGDGPLSKNQLTPEGSHLDIKVQMQQKEDEDKDERTM